MKRKMVFMLLWGVLLSSLPMVAQQVTNKIYIPEMECGRGKTINVPVAISNDSEIVAPAIRRAVAIGKYHHRFLLEPDRSQVRS